MFLYHLLLFPLFLMAMRLGALWSGKIRRGLRGKGDWRRLARGIAPGEAGAFRVHVHAASVGEFEQAKPIIERLRSGNAPMRITASFFSPSGFEQQKSYPWIEGACYLPHDRQGEMSEFLNWFSPDLIIVVRYDLWFEFLRQARLRGIPTVLVCGVLRENSARFWPVARSFFRRLYGLLSEIHCVSEADRASFNRLVPEVPTYVTGDTRYDRVTDRAMNGPEPSRVISDAVRGRTVIVAGSTWPRDEELLECLRSERSAALVLVPHEPTAEHVALLRSQFPGSVTLSQLESDQLHPAGPIVVDRVGLLLELYRLADIAYVGGGFGDGVHSVLEAAAYGVPVVCGPRVERSRDASEMAGTEALRIVHTRSELDETVRGLLRDERSRREAGAAAARFVHERTGAVERIILGLQRDGLLPTPDGGFTTRPGALPDDSDTSAGT